MILHFRRYPPGLSLSAAALIFSFSLLFYGEAAAFSLGQIRVTGALDKKFKAEIPVRVDGKQGLIADVGDESDYKRLGVERPDFLANLSVEVAEHPFHKNQNILYLTSSRPIYQPSFNLVIKARLGSGLILENYFLALDYQKNLSLDLPVSAEEREEMDKIARELKGLRPQADKEEKEEKPVELELEKMAMLEQIKQEERELVAQEEGIVVETIVEPAPAPAVKETVRPVKVSPARPPKPKLAAIPKSVKVAPSPTPSLAPKPEPEKIPAKIRSELGAPSTGGVLPLSADPSFNRYKVSYGDNLYKIAKKLGASSKNIDRVVVALWRDNFSSFIKGNIHGIYENKVLDYSNINETARYISRAQAKKIVADLWPMWLDKSRLSTASSMKLRASLGAPGMGIKVPGMKVPYKSEILAALAGWKQSFVKGDIASMMKLYSDKFKSGGMNKEELRAAREKEGFGGVKIDLNLDDVKMSERDGVIKVVLRADIQSSGGGSRIPRRIYFARESGKYRIVKEEGAVKPSEEKQIKTVEHPYVVHIASFKGKQPAQTLVGLMRKKGYNAFEVLSFIPGKGSWYRVAVDRFVTIAEADLFAKSIKKSGLSRYARILRLPYAIRVGDVIDRNMAEVKIREYSGKGFSAYSIVEGPGGKASILLGAFDSEKSASRALALFDEIGPSSSIIKP